jgi:hypothetical protein
MARGSSSRQSHRCAHSGRCASLERSPAATALRCSGVGRAAELATRCALRSNSRSESDHEARCARRHSHLCCSALQRRAPATVRAPVTLQRQCGRANGGAHGFGLRDGWPVVGRFLGRREAQGGVSARFSALRPHARRGCLSGVARSATQRVPRRDRPPSIAAQSAHCADRPSMSPAAGQPPRSPRKQRENHATR